MGVHPGSALLPRRPSPADLATPPQTVPKHAGVQEVKAAAAV
jgi:hypothetical protein